MLTHTLPCRAWQWLQWLHDSLLTSSLVTWLYHCCSTGTSCSLDAGGAQAPEGDPARRRKVVLAKRQPRQADEQAAAAPKPASGRKERPRAAAAVQPAAGCRDPPRQAGSKPGPGPAGPAPKSAVQQVWPRTLSSTCAASADAYSQLLLHNGLSSEVPVQQTRPVALGAQAAAPGRGRGMAKAALAQQQRKRKADDAIDMLAADNSRGRGFFTCTATCTATCTFSEHVSHFSPTCRQQAAADAETNQRERGPPRCSGGNIQK